MDEVLAVNGVNHSMSAIEYRALLKTLHDELPRAEVASMKFFCSDIIPAGRLENIKDALKLFDELESVNYIGPPSNLSYVAEILYHIGRHDLLKKMKWNIKELESWLQQHQTFEKSYRVLLYKICEDVTKKELEELRFMVHGYLSNSTVQEISTMEDLVLALERKGLLSKNDFKCMEELLNGARKGNLVRLISDFKEKSAHVTNNSSVSDNMSAGAMDDIKTSNSGLVPSDTGAADIVDLNNFYRNLNVLGIDTRVNGIAPPQSSSGAIMPPVRNSDINLPSLSNNVASDREAVSLTNESGAASLNLPVQSSMRHSHSAAQADSMETRPKPVPVRSALKAQNGSFVREMMPGVVGASNGDSPDNNEAVVLTESQSVQHLKEIASYPMKSDPRGICLIINNVNFMPGSLGHTKRHGSEEDEKKLKKLFEEVLKFKVKLYIDCTAHEMKVALQDMAKETDSGCYDCFVCCILSHGSNGVVYGIDNYSISIKSILERFKISNCRLMKGKPKVFFLQACQGRQKEEIATDGPEEDALPSIQLIPVSDQHQDSSGSIPSEPDFLLAYSAVPGYASFRSRTEGTFFITSLVELLKDFHSSQDLMRILTMVTNQVTQLQAPMTTKNGFKVYYQCPAPISTLTKLLYWP